ncbi:MAG TPA: hypothetical protein VLI06_06275 [Solimonas sp.]|nr:hypothetical protein [Solimonas sp.]
MTVMEDLADFFRKLPQWGRQWSGSPDDEHPAPLTVDLEKGRGRIHLAMCCPRCFRSMRLISPPPRTQAHRLELRSLSWHCETCGIQSTRRVHC